VTLTNVNPTPIPGLSARVTTTASSVLYVSTSGAIVNNGLAPGNYVQVDVRLLVDGAVVEQRTYDVELGSNAYKVNWSFATSVTDLRAGTHTVAVDAFRRSASPTNVFAVLAGSETTPQHGTLTVLVLNK
jgi:hypothetical protein